MRNHKPNCQCASCKSKRGEYKGSSHPMFGKHHTEESRQLISMNHADFTGEKNGRYKGRVDNGHGYIYVYCSNHPHCTKDKRVMEHRLVMEKHLGRYLTKEEVVHHINGIKDDNRIENLQLFKNQQEHQQFEAENFKRNNQGNFIK